FYGVPELDEVRILEDLTVGEQTDPYNIEIVPLGDGDFEYAINGGEFQDDPVFLDVPPGINTVIINDKNGCGTTEPIEFLVVGYPKFFTPNGDAVNDNWNVLGVETLSNPRIFIFDRYGKLLKQLDVTTLGWDGTFNGRELPSSDYWFSLDYDRDESGVIVARSVRRHFSLVR
ncbi:MAG: T9SS type B sorting domain-containing protein, partial [Bacteroidota bacterium]